MMMPGSMSLGTAGRRLVFRRAQGVRRPAFVRSCCLISSSHMNVVWVPCGIPVQEMNIRQSLPYCMRLTMDTRLFHDLRYGQHVLLLLPNPCLLTALSACVAIVVILRELSRPNSK